MKKVYMIIPGNPAVAGYYYSWIDEIKNRCADADAIYATSYVLFSKRLDYIKYPDLMFEHYEQTLLNLDSSSEIEIIAHSVGSYFALKLLEKHSDKIKKITVIFPYIGYSDFLYLKFLYPVYLLDKFLPLVEAVSVIKNFFHIYDKEILNISSRELTACLRYGVRQCVYFNKYKLDTLKLAPYKDKVIFIYTEGDRWCPPKTIDLMKSISTSKKVNMPHDFILYKNYREKMIDELDLDCQ